MKAKIYYRRPDPTLPHNKWKYTVKTIEVSKNEPNHILQEFIKITRLPQYTYVTHIKRKYGKSVKTIRLWMRIAAYLIARNIFTVVIWQQKAGW